MAGGSVQLRMFRIALRDGASLEAAAGLAGMSLGEAKLHFEADAADPPPPEAFSPIESMKGHDMARDKKAADKPISGEIPTPDFDRAIRILKADLNPLTEKGAKIRGDQAASWKLIEKDCHCNKKAIKTVHQLMRMDPELRDDYLRSLWGGMQAAGIGISQDMVDKMEGASPPTMPVVEKPRPQLATVN